MFQERRIYPRIPCNVNAELETADGRMVDVQIVNISRSGFYVEGADDLSDLQPPEGLGATEVWLHFGLQTSALHCHCRIIYKRRNAADSIGLGLHIISTDESALHSIDHFVTAHLN
ncbi:PilZ domain-containing protein [Marinobacterium sediminicola]|uniref:PilZ domain-containing protein n=1 Tax=Marinobacterium sediminicola TaxID=518898 RepID=A0ABY1RXG6_9GAMM|nr:PilZ domain-containing protein [Marinobacterium sediminicola]ULG67733.1 PilZ domain-containing protein [Marinobacterium sediminicola]SMR71624.1 PilZ domain-containing protein [Marinobacterium sediminicola]